MPFILKEDPIDYHSSLTNAVILKHHFQINLIHDLLITYYIAYSLIALRTGKE